MYKYWSHPFFLIINSSSHFLWVFISNYFKFTRLIACLSIGIYLRKWLRKFIKDNLNFEVVLSLISKKCVTYRNYQRNCNLIYVVNQIFPNYTFHSETEPVTILKSINLIANSYSNSFLSLNRPNEKNIYRTYRNVTALFIVIQENVTLFKFLSFKTWWQWKLSYLYASSKDNQIYKLNVYRYKIWKVIYKVSSVLYILIGLMH